jgi:hypothetical protein
LEPRISGCDGDGPTAVISGMVQDLDDFSSGRPAEDDQTLVMAFIE